jgi:pimeloyl-ACP methyl ester carboxylesterase
MKLAVVGASARHPAFVYTGGKALDVSLPAIVFLHGALHDHSVWTLLARWFANHGHAVLAPDLPGHGKSDGPALSSVESIADWLIALLDAAGIEDVALVGHSMGSLIALETAARAPGRVRRLVMVATAYPMAVSKALLDAAADDPLAAIDSVNAFSHSTLGAKPSYPGPGVWLHGANRALMRRNLAGQPGRNLFLEDFRACDAYRGGQEAATRVRCPTTFVLGQRDQMTSPRDASALAEALQARTVVLPSGHAVMTEAPDGLLGALREALAPSV